MSSPTAALERRVRPVAIYLACLLAAMALALLLAGNLNAFEAMRSLATPAFRPALRFVTDYGMYPFYVIFIGLFAWGWRRRRADFVDVAKAYLLAQLAGSVLIVRSLKILLAQPRPDSPANLHAQGWSGPSLDAALNSFPSGHTADLFTSAVFLAILLPRPWMRMLALAFALFVGFTRIALAKHYPVDVVGGAFIGGAVSLAVIYWWLLPRLKRKEQGGE